jgi:hypothetical protein
VCRGFYNFAFNPDQKFWRPLYQMAANQFADMGAFPSRPSGIMVL